MSTVSIQQLNRDLGDKVLSLVKDIGETTDVAAQHPEIAERIRGIMREQHTPSKLSPFKAIDGK
jgi:hypothetical protein